MSPFSEFLKWEQSTKDTIDFKKAYVWMTATEDDPDGDVLAGLHLAQIVYWHLPAHDGKPKLRVVKNGKLWLVKRRGDWKDEICLSSRQVDRTTARLVQVGLIETAIHKFDGKPTTHIHLRQDVFLRLWRKAIGLDPQDPPSDGGDAPKSPNGDKEITIPNSRAVKSKSPIGDNQPTNRGTPVTETPTETPTETISADAAKKSEAEFDALPSASSQWNPGLPTGTSHEAIRRALQLACVPSGDQRLLRSLDGEINAASLEAREKEVCRAEDIYERVCGEKQVWYTTYLAEDGQGGLTKPPTPKALIKWLWNLENMRSKLWKPEPVEEPKAAPVIFHAPERPKVNVVSVAERQALARQFRQGKLPEVNHATGD